MPYKDKEKKNQSNKKWKEEHKEQIKQYNQTDQGKKTHRISTWKRIGLICDNIDKLYEHYLNTWECDNCGIEVIEGFRGANKRCMDHNHKTGEFRNILCHRS